MDDENYRKGLLRIGVFSFLKGASEIIDVLKTCDKINPN